MKGRISLAVHDRELTRSERKMIAEAFGWKEVDLCGGSVIGDRPMYDEQGNHYAWLVEEHVPNYDYDTLHFVQQQMKKSSG